MQLAIEMTDGAGYGHVHQASCRHLRDPEPIGDATARAEADELVESATDWLPPHNYSPCVKFDD